MNGNSNQRKNGIREEKLQEENSTQGRKTTKGKVVSGKDN